MRWDSLPYLLLITAVVMLLLMIHIQTSLHAEPSSKELMLSKVPNEEIQRERQHQQQHVVGETLSANRISTFSPSPAPTAAPVVSSSAASVSVEDAKARSRWLVISIPTVARRNNEDYLLQVSRQSNVFSFLPFLDLFTVFNHYS